MTGRTIAISAVAVVLLLAGSVALGIWMQRDGVAAKVDTDAGKIEADADALPGDLVRQQQPLYYTFDPPIVVNIKDTDAVCQAGISLSTHFAVTNQAMKDDDPALRSAIIMALSDASQNETQSDAGKQQLLSRIVSAANQQLRHDGYSGSVENAYFTSFLVQEDSADS